MSINVYRLMNDAKKLRELRGEDPGGFIHEGDNRAKQADRWVAWHSSAAPKTVFSLTSEPLLQEAQSEPTYIPQSEELPALRSFSNYNQIMNRHNQALRSARVGHK